MIKKLLIPLILGFFIAKSQVTTFKLEDYKYRTPGFKALAFSAYSAGSTNSAGSHTFNLRPELTYSKQLSTDDRQFYLLMSGTTGINYFKEKLSNHFISDLGFDMTLTSVQYNGLKFTEYGVSASAALGFTKQKDLVGNQKIASDQITIIPYVGIGKGRLEDVSNAQMVLFILEDLRDAGKIKKEISAEIANNFTDFITQLYNMRIFDGRIRRMYELEQIDSFMRANKMLSAYDIKTYNIINDNWGFALQPNSVDAYYARSGSLLIANSFSNLSDRLNKDGILNQGRRYNGTRLYARLLPVLRDSSHNTKADTLPEKILNRGAGAAVEIGVIDSKPISLKFQRNRSAFLNIGDNFNRRYERHDTAITKMNSNAMSATIGGNIGFGYYPNSRTNIYTMIGVQAYTGNNSSNWVKSKNSGGSVSINGGGHYFISYNSILTYNAELVFNGSRGSKTVIADYYITYRIYLY